MKYLASIACLLLIFVSCNEKPKKIVQKENITILEQPIILPEKFDKANIIQEEDYNVWGTNVLKGKDGKYHAIYSRWLKSRGHLGWVTHSEIAHAVSDNLTGPYKKKMRFCLQEVINFGMEIVHIIHMY